MPSEAVTVSGSQSGFMVGRQGREGQDVGRPPCPPVHLWASFLPVPRGRTPQSRAPLLFSELFLLIHDTPSKGGSVPMCTVTPRLPALAGGSGSQQVFFFFFNTIGQLINSFRGYVSGKELILIQGAVEILSLG